jgi:tRNASer (uridine44-2'-O)-methyltransferase
VRLYNSSCGNGLLVHILIECGYDGLGVDIRARKSWAHYPNATREHLHVYSFDPTSDDFQFLIDSTSESQHSLNLAEGPHESTPRTMFPGSTKGRFIIGNHADELQPWVPVFAALTEAEYISIPCCAWEFDQRYQMKKRNKTQNINTPGSDVAVLEDDDGRGIGGTPEEEELERKLKHGEPNGILGLYACGYHRPFCVLFIAYCKHFWGFPAYVLWLARLSRRCGYVIESEALRIPSTKNRALIGKTGHKLSAFRN